MDTFAPDIFGERVCSLHQNIFRLNCNPSVIFFSVMPPTFIQMIKTQMGKHFCKFIGRASYIAAVDQLLSYCRVNLKRQSIFKNQLSCLQCPSEGRNDKVFNIKFFKFNSSLLSLSLSNFCNRSVEYHGVWLIWIVNRIEG